MIRLALSLLLVALMAGCTPRRTDNFDVFVRNDSPHPITIGLAKDGPPYEPHWASPEQTAMRTVTHDEAGWGEVVPPGRSADTAIRGTFHARVYPWLRVYRGDDHTLEELVAIGRDSPHRLDLRLWPGVNNFIIYEEAGELRSRRE